VAALKLRPSRTIVSTIRRGMARPSGDRAIADVTLKIKLG
jgi:hypothetical protein